MDSNNNENNRDEEDENSEDNTPDSPIGFLSDMLSQLFSGKEQSGNGDINSMLNLFGAGNSKPNPTKIAKYFASEIASKDSLDEDEDQESDIEGNNENLDFSQALNENDFTSLFNQMRMMANVSEQKIVPKEIEPTLLNKINDIFEAAKIYVVKNTTTDEIMSTPLVVRDRIGFTIDYLDAMEEPLSIAAKSLNPSIGVDPNNPETANPNAQFDIQSMIASSVGPMMFGVQAGTMIGHLSHRAYGDDDVLLPAKLDKRVSIIASMVEKFAHDWSVDLDEAILYFLIIQSIRSQVRNAGWLYETLNDLCSRYVGAYELNPYKIEELINNIETDGENSVMAINVTPEQMFEALRTPLHDVLGEEIGRISALHKAYVEYVAHKNIEEMVPSANLIREARTRIKVTTSKAELFVEQLFGVDISSKNLELATVFVDGIIEREQEDALHKIWSNPELMPTSAEFSAPGLYLARLEMMDSQ